MQKIIKSLLIKCGFVAFGFLESLISEVIRKWRPKVEFINNDVVLNRKIRKGGKHNYELLIEAMIKMAEDRMMRHICYTT